MLLVTGGFSQVSEACKLAVLFGPRNVNGACIALPVTYNSCCRHVDRCAKLHFYFCLCVWTFVCSGVGFTNALTELPFIFFTSIGSFFHQAHLKWSFIQSSDIFIWCNYYKRVFEIFWFWLRNLAFTALYEKHCVRWLLRQSCIENLKHWWYIEYEL